MVVFQTSVPGAQPSHFTGETLPKFDVEEMKMESRAKDTYMFYPIKKVAPIATLLTNHDCIMMFLNTKWQPGQKSVFIWKLIPCDVRYKISILICQVRTSDIVSAPKHVIVYIDFLYLLRRTLELSCTKPELQNISMILSEKTQSLPDIFSTTTKNVLFQGITDFLEANMSSSMREYAQIGFNIVHLSQQIPSSSSASVNIIGGGLRKNDYRCELSRIVLNKKCLHIKLVAPYKPDVSSNTHRIINPRTLRLLSNMMHHSGICQYVLLEEDQTYYYTMNHPWCHPSFIVSAISSALTPENVRVGEWLSECVNGEYVSDWTWGEQANNCDIKQEAEGKTTYHHTYICGDVYIPWYRVCDGFTDCLHGEDEASCVQYIQNPDQLPKVLHNINLNNQGHLVEGEESLFVCNTSSKTIPMSWVDDLVPDCISNSSTPEDEPQLTDLQQVDLGCKDPHFLPCLLGHPRCFPIHDLCQYDLDQYGHLRFCRNGAHLAGCDHVHCSHKYKCHSSYCVPVVRVCDGIYDCPAGDDEVQCGDTGVSCPGLLRCQAGGCVTQKEVCDGNMDCPIYGDDELFCNHSSCYDGCRCLWSSYVCINVHVVSIVTNNFKHVLISGHKGSMPSIHNGSSLVIVNFTGNIIGEVDSSSFVNCPHVALIDLTNNKIRVIQEHAFNGLANLQQILLSQNILTQMSTSAFKSLPVLDVVNLSYSQNLNWNTEMFSGLNQPVTVELQGSKFNHLNLSTLQGLANSSIVKMTGVSIYNVTGSVPKGIQFSTDVGFVCCLLPPSQCTIINYPSCLCAQQFPGVIYSGEWFLPCLTSLIHGTVLFFRLRRGKAIVDTAQAAINMMGIITSVSILMTWLQGHLFSSTSVHEEGGSKHVWCLITSALQYSSLVAIPPLITLDMHGIYIIYNLKVGQAHTQAKKIMRYSSGIFICGTVMVTVVYSISFANGYYPNLSEFCSLYLPSGKLNKLHQSLLICQLTLQFVFIIPPALLFGKIISGINQVRSLLKTEDSSTTSRYNTKYVARWQFITRALFPSLWGVLLSSYIAFIIGGQVPPEGTELLMLTIILPIWDLYNPIVYLYQALSKKVVNRLCSVINAAFSILPSK